MAKFEPNTWPVHCTLTHSLDATSLAWSVKWMWPSSTSIKVEESFMFAAMVYKIEEDVRELCDGIYR